MSESKVRRLNLKKEIYFNFILVLTVQTVRVFLTPPPKNDLLRGTGHICNKAIESGHKALKLLPYTALNYLSICFA